MNNKCFGIIGGDARQIGVASYLEEKGYCIDTYGISKEGNLQEALAAQNIILPVPLTNDKIHLNMQLCDEKIPIIEIVHALKPGQTVFAGRLPCGFIEDAEEKGVKVYDYLKYEEFSIKNAVPTAEGAIAVAMDKMDITLDGCHALVFGFGRVGKALSQRLNALGAKTYVAARKLSDIAWIETMHLNAVSYFDVDQTMQNFDVIFNTVPALVIDAQRLSKVKKGCVIIDLASMPGGVDKEYAHSIGIEVIHALSLPGKVAPKTAGKIIAQTVLEIITHGEGK